MKKENHEVKFCRETMAKMGYIGKYDPRHILGYLYLELGTLDWCSIEHYKKEVKIAMQCVDVGGTNNAESLAVSFGL